jgi:hypothetical protein
LAIQDLKDCSIAAPEEAGSAEDARTKRAPRRNSIEVIARFLEGAL